MIIFNIRMSQVAILALFGIWLYEKLAVGGLEFAMLSLTILPFLFVGLLFGLITSLIIAIKSSPFVLVRVINVIILLSYIAATVYMAILIF